MTTVILGNTGMTPEECLSEMAKKRNCIKVTDPKLLEGQILEYYMD